MGSKGGSQPVGYRYRIAYHMGLGIGPIDAFLEFRGGDKTAWSGELTASGTININQPKLWGGDSDQGGIVGNLTVLFGDASQVPNAYLKSTFGPQVPAWWGLATVVFEGGIYGSLNPYPQKASYKFRKIRAGWDNDTCWYPETAQIEMLASRPETVTTDGYFRVEAGSHYTLQNTSVNFGTVGAAYVATADQIGRNAIAARNAATGSAFEFAGSQYTQLDGDPAVVAWSLATGPTIGIAAIKVTRVCPPSYVPSVAEGNPEHPTDGIDSPVVVCTLNGVLVQAMNPAHILYYARTCLDMGRVPIEQMDDASFRAGADWYYSQRFGLCTEYDPSSETADDFISRIAKVAGASVTRGIDGKYYLDVANGIYDVTTLDSLTDDDVLDFSEQPTLLDGAANSIAVKYFDPAKKEDLITPPVQALGLIDAFGTISQTNEYPEIPTGDLALRVAERDLRAVVTPLKTFELKTTTKAESWRPNQYKRLQLPKRGIADMVVIVGDNKGGQLKSGARTLTLTQEIYGLPTSSYVQVETGVDTRPPQTPVAIAIQAAFEAPYIDVVAALSRADLAALPSDACFLLGVAVDPSVSRDFTLAVSSGGDYSEEATGSWCPTATVLEASGFDDEVFTLANGYQLDRVVVGSAALWGTELVRIDAINVTTGIVQFGRACGDTVPVKHASGDRIWFYPDDSAADVTEYTTGETVSVKLLTNTGSQQLSVAAAATLGVTFQGRQARPYPPGQFRINGQHEVDSIIGAISLTGVHRDRVQQANQLIDTEMATIGPEPGTTYTARYYVNGVLEHTDAGLATPSSTYTPTGAGIVRIEFEAVRDGLASYQMHVRQFTGGQPLLDESGALITTEDDQTIIMG